MDQAFKIANEKIKKSSTYIYKHGSCPWMDQAFKIANEKIKKSSTYIYKHGSCPWMKLLR